MLDATGQLPKTVGRDKSAGDQNTLVTCQTWIVGWILVRAVYAYDWEDECTIYTPVVLQFHGYLLIDTTRQVARRIRQVDGARAWEH